MNKRGLLINQLDKILETYNKKNSDYGDSVGDTYKKFGDISFLVRITDKYNRLNSLLVSGNKQKVNDESIDDTILDMANYCLLWLVERRCADDDNRPQMVALEVCQPQENDYSGWPDDRF